MTTQLHLMVYASLMAALTALGAYIAIPIGPVPIVLQNLFIFLAGLLLGPKWGTASVAVYILAGIVGLPVFAGGAGGIGVLVGPTGGYLIGFLAAVYVIGLVAGKKGSGIPREIAALVAGALIIYLFGVAWLKILTGMTLFKTLVVGMFPFLIGDALKIAAAIVLARTLRPYIRTEK